MRRRYVYSTLFFVLSYVVVTTNSYSQSCPELPGDVFVGSFGESSHSYLYPGVLPESAPAGSSGANTIGYFKFSNVNVSEATPKFITIVPTLDGTNYGKVQINLWRLNFNAFTSLKIYKGSDGTGVPLAEITTDNYVSMVGEEYVVDGPVTLVFYGSTPNEANNNIIRFLTGDIPIQTCKDNRNGLVWRAFVTPESYIVVDDQESELENEGIPGYNFLPLCMAYFDENRNFVRVEMAFCLDFPQVAPSSGYWHYPGEYTFALTSTANYDVDRNGFDEAIDNLKIARIIWLIQQAAGVSDDEKGNIQQGIWSTQSQSINATFVAGSWADRAQDAVPSIPSPPEPVFSMNFVDGEDGEAYTGQSISVNIPFSWEPSQPGQTNVVNLEVPAGVTIQSVTGGTLNGSELTITGAVATLTLLSGTAGVFEIKAIYNSPAYYNVGNLKVYEPCSGNSQVFLHIGEENLANPFRSISMEWIAPLPLRLVDFDVALEGNAALLHWRTADEVNVSHFEIERSVDAKNWFVLGKVEAGAVMARYEYFDYAALSFPISYYRLKMVDIDNSYAYSSIKRLNAQDAKSQIALYPNPVASTLNIANLDVNSVGRVEVYDQFGVIKLTVGALGKNLIDVRSLEDGLYIVAFTMRNGLSLTQSIVVRK